MTLVAYHVIIVQQVSCHFPDASIFIIVVFISLFHLLMSDVLYTCTSILYRCYDIWWFRTNHIQTSFLLLFNR